MIDVDSAFEVDYCWTTKHETFPQIMEINPAWETFCTVGTNHDVTSTNMSFKAAK